MSMARNSSQPRILLAEDDSSMRQFLVMALQRAGYSVDDVGDGAEALEALRNVRYDLLLADIVMPGVDGIELARQARQTDPAMQIMFITGFAAVAMSARNPLRETAQVLSKPFHLRDLVDQVDRALDAR